MKMTVSEFIKIIHMGESESLEFKKSTSEWHKIIETLCAFANTCGGILIVGVKDNGNIVGQNVTDDTLKNLVNGIALNIEPKLYPSVKKFEYEGRELIVIEMEESPLKPHVAYGRFVVRMGPTNQRGTQDEYNLMLSQRLNGYGFDNLLNEKATIDDIDLEELYAFLESANKLRSLNANLQLSEEVLLEKLSLLRDGRMTNAAILLFGKQPCKFFLGHFENKCAIFNDESGYNEFLSEKEFSGNLIQNYKDVYNFVVKHIDRKLLKDAPERVEVWEYPLFAIQEAIVNMIVHRDYRVDVKNYVEIRPGRIEFGNPGHLFKPTITLERLRIHHPSRPGNKIIAQCFYLMKLFENWGSGTITMINAMQEMGLPEPDFFYEHNFFTVVLKKIANRL